MNPPPSVLSCMNWIKEADFFICELSKIFWGDTVSSHECFRLHLRLIYALALVATLFFSWNANRQSTAARNKTFLSSSCCGLSHFQPPLGVT